MSVSEISAPEPGSAADLAACVDLWVRAVTARDHAPAVAGTAERCRSKFDLPIVSWRVCRGEDAAVVGFGLVTAPGTGAATDPSDAVYFSLLAVDEPILRRGYGARLVAALLADARASGYSRAVLHVLVANEAATSLYESRGWTPQGRAFPHPLTGLPTRTYIVDLPVAQSGAKPLRPAASPSPECVSPTPK